MAPDLVAFGEVGLSGEIRSVAHVERRLNEAARLGFGRCLLPEACMPTNRWGRLKLLTARSLREAIKAALA